MTSDKTSVDSAGDQDARSYRYGPLARTRATRRRGIVRSIVAALAAAAVSFVLLLPARFFGAVESPTTVTVRKNAALALGLLALGAALYAAIAAHRTASRQRPLIRRLSLLALLIAGPLAALAAVSVWMQWR